jgi:mono/diheme cytochrome c family protein
MTVHPGRLGLPGLVLLLVAGLTPHPASGEAAEPAPGERLFAERGCAACHAVVGPAPVVPVAAREEEQGPALWDAGSKFRPAWLRAWLEKPTPIRQVLYGSLEKGVNAHPALPAREAAEVAAYLLTLQDSAVPAGLIPAGPPPKPAERRALILFLKKQPCYVCHQVRIRKDQNVRPRVVGGFTGPSLVEAGKRLNGDWVYAFLKDTPRYDPNGRMPFFGEKPETRFSEQDYRDLAAFVASLGAPAAKRGD